MSASGTSGTGKRKCLYDILGVERNVEDAELRKVYRKLALKWHPDKNMQDPEAATAAFKEIQHAYETLSDPQERAWYDAHREAILRFGGVGEQHTGGEEFDIQGIDLFPYFLSSCYSGFSDKPGGFYQVYRELFETLYDEDLEADDTLEEEYPSFGTSDSVYQDWQQFYNFFSGYVTPRSYSWLDKYDTRHAHNRREARLMEKENKKIRDEAKKERNELVRNLVKFIRKRDKRVIAHNKVLEEKALENARKTEERRLKQLAERAEQLKELENAQGFGMKDMESQLQNLEDAYDSDMEEESNFCVACNKQLRNEKAYKSHCRQQKHLENVNLLKELMADGEQKLDREMADFTEKTIDFPAEEEVTVTSGGVSDEAPVVLDSAEAEVSEPAQPKSKGGGRKKNKKKNAKAQSAVPDYDKLCVVCKETFPSKNKLFDHLKSTGHSVYVEKNKSK